MDHENVGEEIVKIHNRLDSMCERVDESYYMIEQILENISYLRDEFDTSKLELKLDSGISIFEDIQERSKKNVDKLNALVNEFKGCVSLARASIAERKESNLSFELGLQSEIRKLHEEQRKTNELLRHLLDSQALQSLAGNIPLTKEE